jgi:hypothetical protein
MGLCGEVSAVKKRLAAAIVCLLIHASCYVSTEVQVDSRQIPSGFYAPILVVTVQDKVGLDQAHLAELERNAIAIFTSRGISCVSLSDAIGPARSVNPYESLRKKDYRALLEVIIDFWGSKTKILLEPASPSVKSMDTDEGSMIYQPGSIERSEQPSTASSYKQVAMAGSLMDLQTKRVVWTGRAKAGPGLVGRSFIYHRFNRKLDYEELAKHCLRKLAGRLAEVWPKST